MKKILFVAAAIVVQFCVLNMPTVSAADKDKKESRETPAASVEDEMDNLVKLGPGVWNIKKDDTGRVVHLIVIGQARISTIFGAAKGKELARKNAVRDVKAQFISWLGTQAEIRESKEGEETIFLVGDKNPENRSETGKALEKSGEAFKSAASGLIRGLEIIHSDQNPDGEEYTVICGWKTANARAAKDVATNDPGIEDKPSAEAGEKKASGVPEKKLLRQKATSRNAGDYLK